MPQRPDHQPVGGLLQEEAGPGADGGAVRAGDRVPGGAQRQHRCGGPAQLPAQEDRVGAYRAVEGQAPAGGAVLSWHGRIVSVCRRSTQRTPLPAVLNRAGGKPGGGVRRAGGVLGDSGPVVSRDGLSGSARLHERAYLAVPPGRYPVPERVVAVGDERAVLEGGVEEAGGLSRIGQPGAVEAGPWPVVVDDGPEALDAAGGGAYRQPAQGCRPAGRRRGTRSPRPGCRR